VDDYADENLSRRSSLECWRLERDGADFGKCMENAPAFSFVCVAFVPPTFPTRNRATAMETNGERAMQEISRQFPISESDDRPDLGRSASGGRSLARDYFTAASSESRPFPRLVDESHSRCVSLRLHLSVRFSVLSARAAHAVPWILAVLFCKHSTIQRPRVIDIYRRQNGDRGKRRGEGAGGLPGAARHLR